MKSTPSDRKVDTLSAVFDIICRSGGISRSEIAASLSVSIPTVCYCVDVLFETDLLDLTSGESTGGRPSEIIFPADGYILYADVYRDRADYLFYDLHGDMLSVVYNVKFDPLAPERSVPDLQNDPSFAMTLSDKKCLCSVLITDYDENSAAPVGTDFLTDSFHSSVCLRFGHNELFARAAAKSACFRRSCLYFSVGGDGIGAALFTKEGEKIKAGKVSDLRSAFGTDAARVFSACKTETELVREAARIILNPILAVSPDSVIIDASGFPFNEKNTKLIKRSLVRDFGANNRSIPRFTVRVKEEKEFMNLALDAARRAIAKGALTRFTKYTGTRSWRR